MFLLLRQSFLENHSFDLVQIIWLYFYVDYLSSHTGIFLQLSEKKIIENWKKCKKQKKAAILF